MSQADQDIAVEASLKTTGLGSAVVVDDGVVPTIDLRSDKAAEELWKAATQVGFFSVIGHGIPQSTIDEAFGASADFFAQPLEEKKKQSPGDMKNNAGFEYFDQGKGFCFLIVEINGDPRATANNPFLNA